MATDLRKIPAAGPRLPRPPGMRRAAPADRALIPAGVTGVLALLTAAGPARRRSAVLAAGRNVGKLTGRGGSSPSGGVLAPVPGNLFVPGTR